MKIEFIEQPGDEYFTHVIAIDGKPDTGFRASEQSAYPSEEALNLLADVSLKELSDTFSDITYTYKADWSDWEYVFKLILRKDSPAYLEDFDPAPIFLLAMPNINYINWNRHYSIHQVQLAYEQALADYPDSCYYYDYIGEAVFGVMIFPDDNITTLADITQKTVEVIEPVQKAALGMASTSATPDVITTMFDFPEEYKVACKQYLEYFAKFLADMGIKAIADVKETAGKILFTVTPEDKTVALANIQKALRAYMEAPGYENADATNTEPDNDIAILRWRSAVQYLQAQISLAKAEVQAKDATIAQLNLALYVSRQVLLPAGQSAGGPSPYRDEEPIIKGVLGLRKYEFIPGVTLDLPAIFRMIKKLLGFKK